MAKAAQRKTRGSPARTPTPPARAKSGAKTPRKAPASNRQDESGGWATDLVFDVKEPKLAVSLRLDADVLRFFRGFGSGYQTRINEVLKAFMHARQRAGLNPGGDTGGRAAAPKKAARAGARR